MKRFIKFGSVLIIVVGVLVWYLLRPLSHRPVPATFSCLDIQDGSFAPFDKVPGNIFGVGLAYAGHINETASEFDPETDPPIFKKSLNNITHHGDEVRIPSHDEILDSLEYLEPGISKKLDSYPEFPVLMDYETELGFVLLTDIHPEELADPDFILKIGFFIANDLTSRGTMVMGESQLNKYDYWSVAKGFPGFLPMTDSMWIPSKHIANSIPCITIETLVNGQLRQSQTTSDLIYTPVQMLQAISRRYPDISLSNGDLILTGTPGGVVFSSPRWLVRLANLVGLNRFTKLKVKSKKSDQIKFLKPGDKVVVKGEGLGEVEVTISD